TTFHVIYPPPLVDLQASPSAVNAGASTSMIATILGASTSIAPTGSISFYEANTGNLTGPVTYKTVTDPNTGNLNLQGTLSVSPAFTDGYFANYSGDSNYPPSGSAAATIVPVNGSDFAFTAKQNSYTVVAGGTAFYPLFVGFQSNTGPVSFGANACSGLPAEATCSIGPDPTSSTGFVNLQIATTGPHGVPGARASGYRSQLLWAVSTLPFAAILLIGYRRSGIKRFPRLLLTLIM